MELNKYIQVYDNVMPLKVLSKFLQFVNQTSFEEAKIGNDEEINFEVRRTYQKPMTCLDESLTVVHWHNLLCNAFNSVIRDYFKNKPYTPLPNINDMAILKYEKGGFYQFHTDHFAAIPRTITIIYLLNNDYTGGNLCFKNPDQQDDKDLFEIENKANRIIVFPSNFLYPHTVKPIEKGTRYSIVSWAL